MKKTFSFILLLSGLFASAQFSGAYNEKNWKSSTGRGVDKSDMPNSITLKPTSGGGWYGVRNKYTITVPTTTEITFDWNYTNPLGIFDVEPFVNYPDDDYGKIEITGFDYWYGSNQSCSGTMTLTVGAGSNFGFYIHNNSGEPREMLDGISLTISNFRVADRSNMPTAQTFCISGTVADLVAATGNNLNWYAAQTGGTALSTSTALVTGTYYVSETLNSVESIRTPVAVTINNPRKPVIAPNINVSFPSDYSGCGHNFYNGTYINSGLKNGRYEFIYDVGNGEEIMGISYDGTQWRWGWYNEGNIDSMLTSSNTSNGLYPPSSGWTDGYCTPYITWSFIDPPLACYQTTTFNSTTCAWDITGTPPALPTAADQTFCVSATVADLVATGTAIQWYAGASITESGSALASGTALVNGTTYYASQTINGCESARTPVKVTLTANNSVAGTVSSDQLIFTGTQPANITLTGNVGAVQWQSSLNNSTFNDISGATGTTLTGIQMGALTTKRSYRAVVTNSSCASATSGVVTVNVVAPTKVQASQCGQTLAALNTAIVANSVTGATNYRFKVVNGASTQNIETVSRWFYLTALNGGVSYNTNYTISVATKNNGVWSDYGDACLVTTPTPVIKVQASQCGQTLADLNTAIVANSVTGATNYRFKVVNGATTQTIETASRWFYLKSLTGGVSFTTVYTISVAYKHNGVWSDYGDACTVTTPGPKTKVQASQCDKTLAALNTAIVANSVTGATNYRFKVVNGAKTRYAEMANRWVRLTALTGGALFNTTYTISVAVKYNGVWGAYGDECTVTTPSAPLTRPVDLETETDLTTFKVIGYPNPYTNTFQLDITTQSSATVAVRVYDMMGKLIEVRNSGVAELGTMEIGDRYATGVYNVIVTQGTEVKTLRMIKK